MAEDVERAATGPSGPAVGRWIACSGLVAGVALAVATVVAHAANRHLAVGTALPDLFQPFWLINASSALLFTVPGWYLATKRPAVVFGWLALLAGVAHGAAGVGLEVAIADQLGAAHLPFPTLGLWLAGWCPLVEQAVLTAFYGLYPDGRLPRRWKGAITVSAIVLACLGVLNAVLDPFPGSGAVGPSLALLHNPFSLASLHLSADWSPAFFGPSALAVISILVLRWRSAQGDDRRVLSWLVVFEVPAAIIIPISVIALPAGIGTAIAQGSTLIEVSVIVAATLRHRVYGIEIVLNRTLVYASLTVVVAAVYGAVIGVADRLGAGAADAPPFVAALAAAILLAPARTRIQRAVNRLLYGQRDDPTAVLSRVASQLGAAGSAGQLLPGLVAATADVLRLPYVGVELTSPGKSEVIFHGVAPANVVRIPLVHQGRTMGALVVGRRPGERDIPRRERALLDDLASQAAVAAANVVLTEELRRSRERIVTAREEERRRLRNDLHDGLGPQLTGVALGLDLIAESAAPDGLGPAADRLRAEVEEAIADVRRLVQGLRPPRLDEVGLCGALREVLARAERSGMTLHADLPEVCAGLPAAVEVAVYRIATEAVTNVLRHAHGRSCTVSLRVGTDVHLRITDDGAGLRCPPDGVGTTSMRERAEELGGSCTIGLTEEGGCVVDAHVPLLRP